MASLSLVGAQEGRGIQEIIFCRILMFIWPVRVLLYKFGERRTSWLAEGN